MDEISYQPGGIEAMITRIEEAIDIRMKNLDFYRKRYAHAYFTNGPAAKHYWDMINRAEFSEQEDETDEGDDAGSSAEDEAGTRVGPIRRERRRTRTREGPMPITNRHGRLNKVSRSDNFCFICNTSAGTVVDPANNPIHGHILTLVNSQLSQNVTFERIVPELFIMFNKVWRYVLHDKKIGERMGSKSKVYSTHHGGIVPTPHWTVTSIVKHFVEHVRMPRVTECVMETELRDISAAVVSRIVPDDAGAPINVANVGVYEKLFKLRLFMLSNRAKNTRST